MSMAGRMVRYARRRAGLTQRELAAKAGIPQETIARIEKGRVDPRVGTLDRLLAAADFGLEAMPRLGIGIDRSQIGALLRLTPAQRFDVAVANDTHFVELRRSIRRAAEPPTTYE
jgi:transcriptional regulator with XRE-family HTH domain